MTYSYSFNAITTIGVGDIDGTDFGFTIMVVTFVIIGLAVITMCVDLASTQVKVRDHTSHRNKIETFIIQISEPLPKDPLLRATTETGARHVQWWSAGGDAILVSILDGALIEKFLSRLSRKLVKWRQGSKIVMSALKDRDKVTLDDLAAFLAVHEKLKKRPFVPKNVYRLKVFICIFQNFMKKKIFCPFPVYWSWRNWIATILLAKFLAPFIWGLGFF